MAQSTINCAYPFPRALGHFSKAHGGANKERLPFVWKTRLFRGEFKWNGSSRWKFSCKKSTWLYYTVTSLFCFYLKFNVFCTNTFKNLSAQRIQLFLLFLKQSGLELIFSLASLYAIFCSPTRLAWIRHLHISYDTPCFSPKKLCITFVFNVSWV